MVANGRVKQGVVVLTDEVRLPEGLEVTVLVPNVSEATGHSVLDAPTICLGGMLPPATDSDLLDEMLEGPCITL
jgi:hypothetical protein